MGEGEGRGEGDGEGRCEGGVVGAKSEGRGVNRKTVSS